ncbi:hypothetical protein FHETE_5108 [Fusarium heterosporum]|uniref:Uncharacterized protein n=1 Tax=Fusarium heterosporum TaxID=42747 RepID=A0A8H5WR11_FUSHE|nr:hypothetical protein FHETE_5108 [Fusarium heterosporum]
MKVTPGDDFIKSLRLVFDEAGRKGRDAELEFAHLRSIVVEFVASCAHMTAAKARANCTLKFIDGTESENILALPPSKINVVAKRSELDTAATAEEFVEILQTLISEQKSPRRILRQRREAKKRTNTPPKSPEGKIQKRQDAADAANAKLTTTPENAARVRWLHNSLAKRNKSPKLSFVKKRLDPRFFASLDKTMTSDDMDSTEPGAMELSFNTLPGQRQNEVATSESDQNKLEPQAGSISTGDKPSEGQQDVHMEDAPVTDIEEPTCNRRPSVFEAMVATTNIEPDQWAEFKPKLLDMLRKMQAKPTLGESEAAVKRLRLAITHIEPERALIPADTWAEYEKKLIDYAERGYFEGAWAERHEKIGKVIFLKEEEDAMESKDWIRLRAVARIWAMLSEMTAPLHEEINQEDSEKWLMQKLGDITFTRRMIECKEHHAALKL